MISAEEARGPLHSESGPEPFWSTTNAGEAIPGVITPLCWSLWGHGVELGIRDCYARLGALPRREVRLPECPEDRLISVFYGRAALNVNFLCRMGSRLPGSSPDAIARQLLGHVPDELPRTRSFARLPVVAAKLPWAQATIRRDVLRRTAPIHSWWRRSVDAAASLDENGARALLGAAQERFLEMTRVQAGGLFIAVQAVYDSFTALVKRAGLPVEQENALLAGQGSHVETEMIVDLWELSRDRLTLDEFLRRHGYHGPMEGEISSTPWREDPEPVRRLVAHYAARDDDENPSRAGVWRTEARREAERALLASLPAWERPRARFVLAATLSRIPLRGVAKAGFVQSLDVARAAARRLGTHLTDRGVLSGPDDVFYFTADELLVGLGPDASRTAAQRRSQRAAFARLTLPHHWRGAPLPVTDAGNSSDATGIAPGPPASASKAAAHEPTVVRGIAASGGVVEGRVRVVDDPAFTEVEPGEVLVGVTTDPSWASVLFLSSALVVDVGGPLSHAAVVAREFAVPCVVGTGDATTVLRTGDLVRVDGNDGTVELLRRAAADPPRPARPDDTTIERTSL